ncbi:hypothetical protein CPB84DRAFT_1773368 [Gymnopilus junonius]|uniref:RBR-type E3 ubiquitin transferase n=1 Tax=Gymnopilus junonius TaxID=109634 RepID=A0A9P5TQQ8_GYMJU|nr:hypothetical protein CPB84DRAFT_1773368 [Gymnopilus junonius]
MSNCTQPNCENRRVSDSPTLECGHTVDLCSEHISKLIVQTAVERDSSYFECPIPSCGRRITRKETEDWVNQNDDEYIDRCMMNAAISDPLFSTCIRVNCPGAQYHIGGTEAPIVECRLCKEPYCFTHRVSWKENENHDCKTYGTYEGAQMGSDLKPCPKCRLHMTRISGCMHMTCTNCRYEFCWHCLGVWDRNGSHGTNWWSCPFPEKVNI